MTQDIIKEYEKKMCPYCKGNCSKGIAIIEEQSTIYAKCVDYKKDEDKIQGYIKPLERTAKIGSCVMRGFISDWNKY